MPSLTFTITRQDIELAAQERDRHYGQPGYDLSRQCPTALALNRVLAVSDVQAGGLFAKSVSKRLRIDYPEDHQDWIVRWSLGWPVQPVQVSATSEPLHVPGDQVESTRTRYRRPRIAVAMDQMVEEDYD